MIFRNWVFQNFPFLEDDFDALTDYELFCKMVEYMKKSLEKLDEFKGTLNEFRTELDSYKNYFDNLDVQEEINNKLDDMAESGELADIIAQYLGLAGVLAFNTLNDLVEADNIVNGSITRTLGLDSYNDGKGSFYKIRTITSGDVVDGVNIIALDVSDTLIAEKINTLDITVLKQKTNYYTPEMFGAKGNGIEDDTQALLDMIDAIEALIPTESSEYANKDWSYVTLVFNGIYKVSEPITFSNTYGLVLDKFNLIASDSFDGDYLLGFETGNRNLTLTNSILNGNLSVNKTLFIDDYTVVFRIDNCQMTRFNEYGIYANDDQGHELLVSKCKINQVEWSEREDLPTLVSEGVGIYLGTNRHDNMFSDTIINYCRDYSIIINSGSNFFNNMHFYWQDVQINGFYNFINNSYFDGTKLEIMGMNYVDSCYFGSDDGNAFIKINETYSNKWRTAYSRITNSTFENKGVDVTITNSIDFDSSWSGHESELNIETIGNSFKNCPTFLYRSPAVYQPEQWKTNIWTGTNAYGGSGSVRIGDLLIQYGTISSAGSVSFPIEYTLAPFIVAIDQHGAQSSMPMANNITVNGFYANGVSVESTWYAIGRMNA